MSSQKDYFLLILDFFNFSKGFLLQIWRLENVGLCHCL